MFLQNFNRPIERWRSENEKEIWILNGQRLLFSFWNKPARSNEIDKRERKGNNKQTDFELSFIHVSSRFQSTNWKITTKLSFVCVSSGFRSINRKTRTDEAKNSEFQSNSARISIVESEKDRRDLKIKRQRRFGFSKPSHTLDLSNRVKPLLETLLEINILTFAGHQREHSLFFSLSRLSRGVLFPSSVSAPWKSRV